MPKGRRLRREHHDQRLRFLRSKPPGHLAIIPRRMPWHLRDAVIEAATPARRARLERRRARALLLGALRLRIALLEAIPECASSLWLYGVP